MGLTASAASKGSSAPPQRRRSSNPKAGRRLHVSPTPPLVLLEDKSCQTVERRPVGRARGWLAGTLPWVVTAALVCYAALVLTLALAPSTQRVLVFGNWLQFPFWVDFADPGSVGLPHARHVWIPTDDGERLGAWHVLPAGPAAVAALALEDGEAREEAFDVALQAPDAPVVLFFHGNSGNRGWPKRREIVKLLSALMRAHVVAVDYRGFGDSTGVPSEEGVAEDARAVLRWATSRMGRRTAARAPPAAGEEGAAGEAEAPGECAPVVPVFLYGQSLGTGVATRLAEDMSRAGRPPLGLVLDAPFTNMTNAAMSHPAGAILRVPVVVSLMPAMLRDRFPSHERIQGVASPVLIFHGALDGMIPVAEGRRLAEYARTGKRARGDDEELARYVELPTAGHTDIYSKPMWAVEMQRFTALAADWQERQEGVCEAS